MADKVEFTIDATDSGAVRAWQEVAQAVVTYQRELAKLDAIEKKNEQSALAYDRAAKKVLDDLMTPQQRYNRKLEELNVLRQKNKLTEEQYAAAVRKTKQEFESANVSQKAGMLSAVKSFGQFAAAVTGVGSAIGGVMLIASQLKREYENIVERQRTAAEAQITLAEAQRTAVFNLGGDQSLTPDAMTKRITEISRGTGVREEVATRVFSDMLSARGQMPAADVLPYLENVLRAAPDQGGLPILGGATLDLGKAFGLDPKQALGFMLQTQASSRVTSLQSLAQNVIPSVLGVSKFGDSPEQAAELAAALGQAGGDITGAQSGTSAVQLAARLAQIPELAKLGSTAERIEAVRGSSRLQKKVFAEEFGEAKFKPILKQLLTGGEDTAAVQAYRAAQAGITAPAAAAPTFEGLMSQYGKLPLSQTAELGRELNVAASILATGDIGGGRAAISRQGLQDILKAAGVGDLGQKLALAEFEVRTGAGEQAPIEAVIDQLRRQAYSSLNPTRIVDSGLVYGEGLGGYSTEVRAPTANERRVGDELNAVADALQRLVVTMQKNNQVVEENNKQIAKQNGGGNAPNSAPPRQPAAAGRR